MPCPSRAPKRTRDASSAHARDGNCGDNPPIDPRSFPMTRFVCAALAALMVFLCSGCACRRRHVDLPRLSIRQGQHRAEDQSRPGVARPRSLRHRAPLELHGEFRVRRRPDPHQPSLRRVLPRRAFVEGQELRRRRLPGEDPRRGKALPDPGGRHPHRHGRNHREGFGCHRWQGRDRCQRRAQVHAHAARRRMREAGHAEMPDRHALRRRAVLALQIQALYRRAHRVRAGSQHRRVRRRP